MSYDFLASVRDSICDRRIYREAIKQRFKTRRQIVFHDLPRALCFLRALCRVINGALPFLLRHVRLGFRHPRYPI